MKKWYGILLLVFGVGLAAVAAERKIVVACCGDSITQGVGVRNPAQESYPAQLQKLLGEEYQVLNLGVGGRALLRKKDPYSIGNGLKANPDIVIMALGTNDSREANWSQFGHEFVGDYLNLIDQFRTRLAKKPEIFVVLPPPIFVDRWELKNSILQEKTIPAIRQVAEKSGARLIDFNTPMLNRKQDFADGVHPNAAGAAKLAEIAARALQEAKAGK